MGLFDDEDELEALFKEATVYPSCVLDLNEGNVEILFNKCLATNNTKEIIRKSVIYEKFTDSQKHLKQFLSTSKQLLKMKRLYDIYMVN